MKNLLPADAELEKLGALMKVFGDKTRLRILYCLKMGEMSVTEICERVEMDQSAVSHQLRVLKDSRLIKSRREGRSMLYSLCDGHVESMIILGLEHVEEQ